MRKTTKILAALLTLIALSAAGGCQTVDEPTPTPGTEVTAPERMTPEEAKAHTEQWLKDQQVLLGGDLANPPNRVDVVPNLFPLPPGWTPPDQPPRPGYRLYTVKVETVDQFNLPTVRRFGIAITGFDDQGQIAMLTYLDDPGRPPQPFLLESQESSPFIYDLEIGPGIVNFNIQILLVGRMYEGVIVTVEEFGTGPTGIMGGGRIEPVYPNQQRGAVVVQLPVAVLPPGNAP